jgi:hypothetical protein
MSVSRSRSRRRPARVKRPKLSRNEPRRSWSGMFDPSKTEEPGGAGPGPADPIRRGVELGYRVINDYVKQGTAAASAFGRKGAERASTEDLPKMTERMMQYASDFTAVWFDAMGLMMENLNERGAYGQPPSPAPTKTSKVRNPSQGRAPKADTSRLILDVQSTRPAQIVVTLDEPLNGSLEVPPLRARLASGEITDVSVEAAAEAGGAVKVRVYVPAALGPGRYTGAILDKRTGLPRGRLTVIVAK